MVIEQNSEKFDSETSKLQPVNQSEASRHTASIHQRAADSLPLKCNGRLINGLFHSSCLDFHEKIITLKLALSQ